MLVTPTTLYHIPLPHRLSIHQEILQSHLLCHIIYVVVVVNLLLRVVIVGGSDGGFEDGLFLDLTDNLSPPAPRSQQVVPSENWSNKGVASKTVSS